MPNLQPPRHISTLQFDNRTGSEKVATWGLSHGKATIWVKLLGPERARKLTRYFFGPLAIAPGLFGIIKRISGRGAGLENFRSGPSHYRQARDPLEMGEVLPPTGGKLVGPATYRSGSRPWVLGIFSDYCGPTRESVLEQPREIRRQPPSDLTGVSSHRPCGPGHRFCPKCQPISPLWLCPSRFDQFCHFSKKKSAMMPS
jgi:hypothetical protein